MHLCRMAFWSLLALSIADASAMTASDTKVKAGYTPLPSGQCDISSNAKYDVCATSYTNGNPNTLNGAVLVSSDGAYKTASAARILSGSKDAVTPVDAFGYCRYVINLSSSDFFLPFNTSTEWTAFLSSAKSAQNGANPALSGVSLLNCSRGGYVSVPPNFGSSAQTNQCASANPVEQWVVAPYMPYPPSALFTSPEVTFNCSSADGTAFVEKAVAKFQGLDSGAGEPANEKAVGWQLSDVLYYYDGVCGAATTVPSSSNPVDKLCHVGVPSAVVKSPDGKAWNWTCSGGNGGGNTTSCALSVPPGCKIGSYSFDVGSLVSYLKAPNGTTLPGTYTLELAPGTDPGSACYCKAPGMTSVGLLAKADGSGNAYCDLNAACRVATVYINSQKTSASGMFNSSNIWCYYPMARYISSCAPIKGSLGAYQCSVSTSYLRLRDFDTVPSGITSYSQNEYNIFHAWIDSWNEKYHATEISIDKNARASYFSVEYSTYKSEPITPNYGGNNFTGSWGSGGGVVPQ